MSSRRKPATLDYQSPLQMSVLQKLAPFRWLFWPLAAAVFLATFLAAGGGAVAVYELVVHLPLLAAWLLAAYGWGSLLKKGTSLFSAEKSDVPFSSVTAVAIGLGLMSLATLGLGLVGAMSRPVAIGMVLVGVVIAVVLLIRRRPEGSPQVEFVHWPWLLVLPALAIMVLCALLPAGLLWGMDEPNGYDVVSYHLQVPREWYESGRISGLHHNVYSFFPFNVEMHYLLAMHLMGGPWAGQFLAQLMHAAYMGLFVAAVYGVASQYGRGRGMIAALLAAAPPWVPMLGSIAYNEGGLLLYGTLAIGWALRALSPSPGTPGEGSGGEAVTGEGQPQTLTRGYAAALSRSTGRGEMLLAGVMAGLASGCKLTAVPILLLGIPLAVLIVNWRQWKGMAVFVIAGLVTFSPWLIRNAVWTGNPVFPELQSVLGRGHFSPEQSARWHRAHKPRADQQAMSVRVAELGRQVFADWRFGFVVVPVGIIAMLFALRQPEGRVILILLGVLSIFWLTQTHLQGRFYVLAIPLAAVAVAMVLDRAWPGFAWPVAVIAVLLGIGGTFERLWSLRIDFNKRGVDLMSAAGSTAIDSAAGITEDSQLPIVLVGDAKTFFYQVPMSRLHYRTVFDVDTNEGRPLSEAYTAGLPEGTEVVLWVDLDELGRFHRTYKLPDVDGPLINLGMRSPYALRHVVTRSK